MVSVADITTVLPKLEPPAPNPTSAFDAPGGPSFQDHLQRAGRPSDADSNRPADENRIDASHDDGPPSPHDATSHASEPPAAHGPNDAHEASDDAPTDKSPKSEQSDKPVVEKKPTKENHHGQDDGKKQKEGQDAAAAAAAAATLAQPLAKDEKSKADEVVLTGKDAEDNADKKGAKAAAHTKAKLAKDATKVDGAATKDAEAKNVDPTAGKKSPVAEATNAAAVSTTAKDKAKDDKKQDAPTKVDASTTVQAQAADNHDGDGKSKDTAGDRLATSAVAANPSPADVAATSTAADATAAAAIAAGSNVASPRDDKKTKTDEAGDKVGATNDPNKVRADRPPSGENFRPATHHDVAGSRTEGTDAGRSLSYADRARLVQRVAKAVQTAQERGGELKLRLSPPELGSLRLQVSLNDGALSARIEAETPAARQTLVDNLPALRERLAEQNIRVEKFDVDLFQSGGGGGAFQMPQQQMKQDDLPMSDVGPRRGSAPVAGDGEAAASTTGLSATGAGGLNVIV